MTNAKPYFDNNQLHVGDCKELVISNVAHTTLHTLKRAFTLSNVLHVPKIKNWLLSIQQFCHENCLFWIHSSVSFYVKDHITNKGFFFFFQSKDDLYVLLESSTMFMPQSFWSTSLSTFADVWHHQLGYPSSRVLNLLA
jgi:hypothetical protein